MFLIKFCVFDLLKSSRGRVVCKGVRGKWENLKEVFKKSGNFLRVVLILVGVKI